MTDKKIYTYISHQGKEYPVTILARHEHYVDIEFLPENENLTMLSVLKHKIKELGGENVDIRA